MAEDVYFGRYRLLTRLGQGGMGEVWHARVRVHDDSERDVVVKRMLSHLSGDRELVHAFAREARLCGMLDHPNIVRMFEFGDVNGEHYLAMEYVSGINLLQLQRARRAGGIDAGAAASVIASVCRALAYAYEAVDEAGAPLHLVHRDVTPSNVMIARDGEVKLLDFGIAKALAEVTDSQTNTGTLKGKFGYMAPELVEGGRADHRSDQFSAGVMLHELLTGRRLFRGETDLQTIAKVREAVVSPPSEDNRAIEPALDRVVLRALARDPAARFPDCTSMAEALEAIAAAAHWNKERSAALVDELSPGDAIDITSLGVGPEHTARATQRRSSAAQRSRLRVGWFAVGLVGVAAIGALVLLIQRRPPSEPAPTERNPASARVTIAPTVDPPAHAPAAPNTAAAPVVASPSVPSPTVVPPTVEHTASRSRARAAKKEPVAPKPAPQPAPKQSKVGQVRAGKLLDPFSP